MNDDLRNMTDKDVSSTAHKSWKYYCVKYNTYCEWANIRGLCNSTACKIFGGSVTTLLCPHPIGTDCRYAVNKGYYVECLSLSGCIQKNEGEVKTMEIKDSGERTEFESGAKRDLHEGKGRMDLLPWEAIMEVSKHCENGAKKYGEHNVDKGIPVHSFCDSAMRHMAKYMSGWDDEPHLLAAAWNILWAVQMTKTHPELVDVPYKANDKDGEKNESK